MREHISIDQDVKDYGVWSRFIYCSKLSPAIILTSKTHAVELDLHVLLNDNKILVHFTDMDSAKKETVFKRSCLIARIRGEYTLNDENDDSCEYTINGAYSVYCNNNIPYVLFVKLGD